MSSSLGFSRIESLTKDNYETWKIQMKAILVKNDSWKYITETEPKPKEGDRDSTETIIKWKEGDEKAKADIILCINPSELKQIKNCETSRGTWKKLEEIYQSKGPARKASLMKSLIHLKLNEGGDMHGHMRQFFDIVDKLQQMDIDIDEELLSVMLLYSLPQSFENFRCAIESRDELPKPEILRLKIVEEHTARREANGDMEKSNAFSVAFGKRNFGNESGKRNFRTEYYKNENTRKPKIKCFKCQRIGHRASECRFKKENFQKSSSVGMFTDVNPLASAFQIENKSAWCLDSGCTMHMSNEKEAFLNVYNSDVKELKLANNQSTDVIGTGTAVIKANVNGKPGNVDLKNTLLVPNLRTNLLSVAKICDKNFTITFRKDCATIRNSTEGVQLIADRIGDLYYLRKSNENSNSSFQTAESSNVENKNDLLKWHFRMGHLNVRDIVDANKKGIIRGLSFSKVPQDFNCEICFKGKLSKSSFPKKSNRSSDMLEIIHTDICGPMRTESKGKSRYFITFIDDFSKWCEIRFLKHKSEALSAFKEVKALMEKQTGKQIKILQSDNGTEFLSNNFNKFLKCQGIKRRLTVPYCPEQNGVAERRNRTLADMARCSLLQSKLTPSFWAEAISTANYVRNRCPTKSLKDKTPYELWYGQTPNVNYFKTFGCTAYCLNNNPNKGKFSPRSKKGVFVGYSEQSKGYRIWITEENHIEISRHVKFLENIESGFSSEKYEDFFPFNENPSQSPENETAENNSRDVVIPLIAPQRTDNPCQIFDSPLCEERESEESAPDVHQSDSESQTEIVSKNGARRRRGRPRKIKTGLRGRPRKEYNVYESELSQIAEVGIDAALLKPEASEWLDAMADELKCILKNDTWDIVKHPEDRDIIGSRFVLRNKYNSDGTLERRKARLVAQGFNQQPGVDFAETFSPVARLSSIRLMTALAVKYGLNIHHFDITTAFLNGTIEEDIYMRCPKYITKALEIIIGKENPNSDVHAKAKKMLNDLSHGDKVCKLKKSLYGLKQSGRRWYIKLDEILNKFGAKHTAVDPCVYIMRRNKHLSIITVYVDDILVMSQDPKIVSNLKTHLESYLDVKYTGLVKHCLGIDFSQHDGNISISQQSQIRDLLERFKMSDCKPVTTPIDISHRLKKSEEPPDEKLPYRELIGSLMYLAVSTRPDIAHAVSALSQFLTCYDSTHWTAAKRVLRYLKKTINHGLIYKPTDKSLHGYTDSDWGNCPDDRKSYTGYCFILSGGAISWNSKKQRTVALSSTESEYMSLSEGVKEGIYLRKLLHEINPIELSDIKIFVDNRSALKLAENNVFHSRSKHIDIRHHFVRDAVNEKLITLEYIPTEEMGADILTKGLSFQKHLNCTKIIGICDVTEG